MILHHEVRGDGPALLLLHSTACDGRQWEEQLGPLSARHRVVVPDLRGYGGSALTAEAYSDTADILALLDHLGIESAAVVGSSGGGHVALQLASYAPDRVTSLLLLCAASDGVEPTASLREFSDQEDRLIESGDVVGATALNVDLWLGPEADAEARERVRVMQDNAFRVQLAAGDDIQREDVEVDLSAVTADTTVVHGAHDLDYFTTIAHLLQEQIPTARSIELAWAGHLPNLERPGEITDLILAVA